MDDERSGGAAGGRGAAGRRAAAAAWTWLLGAGLALVLPPAASSASSKAFPRPPRLIGCVFLNRANVTCRWEAGDALVTRYTLQVQGKPGAEPLTANSSLETFTCSTSDTSCTAGLSGSSVRFTYCVVITAHTGSQDVSSAPRCQPGRTEVMLPPAILNSVQPVSGKPRCLNVTWSRTLSVFPVSASEIKAGNLNSQIEITAEGQLDIQVKNVTVKNYNFQVCLFRPDTSFTIRLRHRYRGPESPWSLWSNSRRGRTVEDAPSAAPAFWRRVKRVDKDGQRLISLLWKPLPHFLANGKVLYYNVTCQTESAHFLNSTGSCRDLHHTRMSCSLLLPAGRCCCCLTASNSAGTSPEAPIWLPRASETEAPSLSQITASPLDEHSVDVRWTPPADRSVSGFVVEWFAVREKNSSTLCWERLNRSCTALVITEGVKPMERYAVSVTVLYGERGAGENSTLHIYTVQGAPSAGPTVKVKRISGSTVQLSWSPVSVELLHGFIRNYTLCYAAANQPARNPSKFYTVNLKGVFVPGHVRRYSLKNLLPGNYDIFMRANTDAGAGEAGPISNVHIGSEDVSVVMYTILPLILTSLALVLMACLAQNDMVKQKLCHDVPDPSCSSVAHWTPKTTLETLNHPVAQLKPEIINSQGIFLREGELQNRDVDLDNHSVCNLQTRSSAQCSPPSDPGSPVPLNNRLSEKSTGMISIAKLSFYPPVCSSTFVSQTPQNSSSSSHSSSYCHTVSFNDVELRKDGGKDPAGGSCTRSESYFSSADELKSFHLFLKHQIPVSFSDVSTVPQSNISLSPERRLSPSHLDSVTFTHADAAPDTVSSFLSPLFVDLSYCSVECDPYISSAV